MIIKKKLRDVTPSEYEKYYIKTCQKGGSDYCKHCMFRKVDCRIPSLSSSSWVLNKDIYSDNFLNQEIKIGIEVNVDDILTTNEKLILREFIAVFKDRVISICKKALYINKEMAYIVINVRNADAINEEIVTQFFKSSEAFKGMEINSEYTIEELGL